MVPWFGLWSVILAFPYVPRVGLLSVIMAFPYGAMVWSVIVAFPYGAMGWSVVCDCGSSLWCHGLVCCL